MAALNSHNSLPLRCRSAPAGLLSKIMEVTPKRWDKLLARLTPLPVHMLRHRHMAGRNRTFKCWVSLGCGIWDAIVSPFENGIRIPNKRNKEKMRISNIADKVVVITGASSGVGESTARLLAGNGAKVALGARRKDRIDALVRDINAKGGSALGFKTDVTKRGDVEALVRGSVDKYGRIDAIVNNSGIMPIAPMAALKVEEWDRMIDVNIKGLLY